jgi:peptide/nickel transport system ATP-binding protein
MQIVFQDPYSSLNPRIRIGEAVAEGMIVHSIANRGEARSRAVRLLEEVGLTASDASRFPHELSGGQRQRVAIARALAVEPDFLVLDEAVSALDVTTQDRILQLFERIRDSRGLTCLFIAHNLAVVQRIATVVAVMNAGQIVEMAPAGQLFAAPQHPYTRALLEAVPGRRYLTGMPAGSSG